MLDLLGIGMTQDVFQLECKEQLVIERLKSLTSTGVKRHATPLSTLAEMPSGQFDLVVSSVDNRPKTSS